MQSSDPSVTIGTKFSHFQESSSECDSLQTWASVQPASPSQRISQIHPAAVSPALQQRASEPQGMRGAGRVAKGAHRARRRGKALGCQCGAGKVEREGLGRLGRGQGISAMVNSCRFSSATCTARATADVCGAGSPKLRGDLEGVAVPGTTQP